MPATTLTPAAATAFDLGDAIVARIGRHQRDSGLDPIATHLRAAGFNYSRNFLVKAYRAAQRVPPAKRQDWMTVEMASTADSLGGLLEAKRRADADGVPITRSLVKRMRNENRARKSEVA